MPDASPSLDSDFSSQLRALVVEAVKKTDPATPPPASTRAQTNVIPAEEVPIPKSGIAKPEPPKPDVIKPVMHGLEALGRFQMEQSKVLERIDETVAGLKGAPAVITEAKHALEQRNLVNRAMFEALHAELKSYKDSFLLDAVLKPVIRDIISLYDDTKEIHRQIAASVLAEEARTGLAGTSLQLLENVQNAARNVQHHLDFILEIMERMDVTLIPRGEGKLDKRSQRAVLVEPAANPEEDQLVVKIIKRGFQWRDRVLRPEEVVIKKWSDGSEIKSGLHPAPENKANRA